jgi:hypothetical protein
MTAERDGANNSVLYWKNLFEITEQGLRDILEVMKLKERTKYRLKEIPLGGEYPLHDKLEEILLRLDLLLAQGKEEKPMGYSCANCGTPISGLLVNAYPCRTCGWIPLDQRKE